MGRPVGLTPRGRVTQPEPALCFAFFLAHVHCSRSLVDLKTGPRAAPQESQEALSQ